MKSVTDQYNDAAYSDFVQSPENALLYDAYYHFSFMKLVRSIIEERLERAVDSTVACAVLDAGAGNAILSRKIANEYTRVVCTGVDMSLPMIEAGRRLIAKEGLAERIELYEGDIRGMGPDGKLGPFDLGISGFVICHMHSETELTEFFSSVARLLKPGGASVHIVPHVAADGAMRDGAVKRVALPLPPSSAGDAGGARVIELYDVHWSRDALSRAVAAAGLTGFRLDEGCIQPGSKLEESMLPGRVSILSAIRPLESS